MGITVFSFVMAVIWNIIFVVIIYFIRKNDNIKKYFGVKIISFLYIFCIVRIVFPLEFNFTKVIPIKKFYTDIFSFIHLNKIGNTNISILNILIFIWAIVAGSKIIKFICSYNKTYNKILELSVTCNNDEWTMLNNIKLELNSHLVVNILKSDLINIPIALGLFKKNIVLPNKEYSEKDLYYILIHEYTHFINKDIFIKIMSNIFCYIFWWILPIKLLIKDLEQVLEIKCDLNVTNKMNDKCKIEYMNTIVNSLKNINKGQMENIAGATLLNTKKKSYITERFAAIMNTKKIKYDKVNYFIIILIVSTCILSYSFVLQPDYEAPTGESISIDESYIVKTKDGKFLFYADGDFMSQLNDKTLELFLEYGYKLIREE